MLTRRPLEIAGVGAHIGESTSRVAAASYHLEVLVTDWGGQLLRRQAPEGNLIRRLAAYLCSPLVPDRELLPTGETSAAGIPDAYRSVLRP